MKPITEIASELNIRPEELEPYGHYKAKLSDSLFDRLADRPNGKLVLVTAIGKVLIHVVARTPMGRSAAFAAHAWGASFFIWDKSSSRRIFCLPLHAKHLRSK